MLLHSPFDRDNLGSENLSPKLGRILKIGARILLISISSRFGSPSPLCILMWNQLAWFFETSIGNLLPVLYGSMHYGLLEA